MGRPGNEAKTREVDHLASILKLEILNAWNGAKLGDTSTTTSKNSHHL